MIIVDSSKDCVTVVQSPNIATRGFSWIGTIKELSTILKKEPDFLANGPNLYFGHTPISSEELINLAGLSIEEPQQTTSVYPQDDLPF